MLFFYSMVVEPDCDTQKVSDVVSGIVVGSEINRVHGKELDITLPYDGVSKFSGENITFYTIKLHWLKTINSKLFMPPL